MQPRATRSGYVVLVCVSYTNLAVTAEPLTSWNDTDAKREWAYDRKSHVGKLDKALTEATANNWTVVDMKKDWKRVYPSILTSRAGPVNHY
jgi:hypothetical protein